MKRTAIIIVFALISFSLFAQKLEYRVQAGVNYSFFNSTAEKQMSLNNSLSSYSYVEYNILNVDVESVGFPGFYVNNDFSFFINRIFSFKTGFGLCLKKSDYQKVYTINENASTYVTIYDSTFTEITGEINREVNDYSLFLAQIPLQLQAKLFKETIFISGGIDINAIIKALSYKNDETYTAKTDFENLFLNMIFDVDYKLSNKILIGTKFERNITNVLADDLNYYYPYFSSNNISDRVYLNTFSVNISYLIN